jgi:ADP-ribose pyrophosphatase YjhB (NUDIX family)
MSTKDPTPSFHLVQPEGDDRLRQVCTTCGFINYVNPKIVVGSVVVHDEKILFCRRAIEPRRGFWTLPAGFMEEGETVEEGAIREAREEACAEIIIDGLLAFYSVPRISQVQLMFRARLSSPHVAPGPESLDVAFFALDDAPWGDLALPSVQWALDHYRAHLAGQTGPFGNPPGSIHR